MSTNVLDRQSHIGFPLIAGGSLLWLLVEGWEKKTCVMVMGHSIGCLNPTVDTMLLSIAYPSIKNDH